jgi:hypothetical protein
MVTPEIRIAARIGWGQMKMGKWDDARIVTWLGYVKIQVGIRAVNGYQVSENPFIPSIAHLCLWQANKIKRQNRC